jgi:hypothetical protein
MGEFIIYALSVDASGCKTVEGALIISRSCTRAQYDDERRLFRARMPEQMEWFYDVR